MSDSAGSESGDVDKELFELGEEGVFVLSDDEELLIDNLDCSEDNTSAMLRPGASLVPIRSLCHRMESTINWETLLSILCMDGKIVFTER